MRLSELRSAVQPPTSNPYDALLTRHVSLPVTAALAPLGVSANQVSAVNLFVGLASCALIAFGDRTGVIAGVVLVHVYAVLDSVDGELARLRRQFSLTGLFLEDLSAFYMIAGFPLAVAYHLTASGGSAAVLMLAITYAAFGRNAMSVARRAMLKSIRTRRPVAATAISAAGSQKTAASIRGLIDNFLLNHTIIRVVVSTALLVELLMGSTLEPATGWILAAALWGLLGREALAILFLLRRGALDRMLDDVYRDARVVNTNAASVDAFELARS